MFRNLRALAVGSLLGLLAAAAVGAAADRPMPSPNPNSPIPCASLLESARELPLAYDVDVVVVGGTSGGVAAACAAASRGATVFLAAPRPYVGEDLAGTMRLWLDEGETPDSPLAKRLFDGGSPATPLAIKTALDAALLQAKVTFLTGCLPTDVLRDADGNPAGIVMANRSGRQAVRAKVIVDATERAVVARMAGAKFSPYPSGPQTFTRVVISAQPIDADGVKVRKLKGPARAKANPREKPAKAAAVAFDYYECAMELPMRDGSWRSFAEAEQAARDKTWNARLGEASDSLFQVPPDAIQGAVSQPGDFAGAAAVDLGALRPAGVPRVWIAGGCADVSRAAAAKLVRAANAIALGQRVGLQAADEAKKLPAPGGVRLAGAAGAARSAVEVRESLAGLRPALRPAARVPAEARALPVLGEYDVVVIGGGTGGAPAGIGAGRQGAKTLLVEYLPMLGGVGTYGLIGKYWFGNRVGFTAEHDAGVRGMGALVHVNAKAEWWRVENRRAGTEIWFGCLGCGALVEGGKLRGAVVATPFGRGAVLAKVVIDATGGADIAAAAGAECVTSGAQEIAVQGTGLPPRNLGASYTNTDYLFVDETDAVDLWQHFLYARAKYPSAFDVSQLIDSRERRRIVGDIEISPMDIVARRTFPDTITIAKSNFDTHGYTVHPLFLLRAPHKEALLAQVPLRCLLPKGLEGIAVTGLAVSAQRDALPVIRMQADVQNQGYAIGVAAATAAKEGTTLRRVDVRALQRHLVEKGLLPAEVLGQKDSFPLPAAAVASAVAQLANNYNELEIVLAHLDQSIPLLRNALKSADGEAKLIYAHVLGMLGDASGAEVLAKAVAGATWDRGWNFKGMGQFGASISPLDSKIIALGRTRHPGALRPLLDKAAELDAGQQLSHHRAVALALEALGDKAAAPALAAVLAKEGIGGHAILLPPPGERPETSRTDGDAARSAALRELMLARALYRCGDHGGLGEKTLRQFAQDVRGHFARHAAAVIEERTRTTN
ncbi:MAG: FAD-dependent oxidoreductase [Thermoguttaceae bacterium]